MMNAISLARPESAETVWVLTDQVRFMGSLPGTDLHVMQITVPPGSGTPPHRHASFEIFHVTEGALTFGSFDGGAPTELTGGPGCVLTVPSNAAHNYTNRSATAATMLVVVQQPMRDFFAELGTPHPPPPGPPPAEALARVMAACARHGITILAP